MIPPLQHITGMAPYALASLPAASDQDMISLAQNESLRPPSPQAIAAAKNALAYGQLYPDPDWSDLRTELAGRHGLKAENILCGAGSMELIAALAQCYLDDRNIALASEYSYAFFRTASERVGSRLVAAKENGFKVSIDSLLATSTAQTRLVFIANPGNPTGTRIPTSDLIALRNDLADGTLLIIDEAYGEFADGTDQSAFNLVDRGDTVVLRTLSKAYGLASMRVGWGYFPPDVATQLRKILTPNNVSSVSQAAATAAVADHTYMRHTTRLTKEIRLAFSLSLKDLGLEPPASDTNFVLIPFKSEADATAADAALRRHGFVARGMGGYGLPNCLRLTISQETHMKSVIRVLASQSNQGLP
ncbi:aminotransferase class I/II-fold pyridoxal phosphate-dependent enzyme [Roseobacter sp. YSTF-M11]|uniref:Aminotransferase class I/II-fold pyridoxal phosphate-dependent enzyme n=1 Tax=Roseobacter insulae TaxID=2859783 RepID=A0A9X1K0Z2_9RHOB|nr:histidinol-phosphate transaminase [Roseobacter insulae]MBW4707008.1 aminotransferase class I/II-fold pyridoxal phosphate-dependent enzyme [Roseobacter insulae]